MDEFLRENFKDAREDSKKDRERFFTREESAQAGLASTVMLLVMIALSFIPYVSFTNIALFLVLTELVAIKDTLRKSLTRVQ